MSTTNNVVSLADWSRARTLDRGKASSRVRAMTPREELLHAQDWAKLKAQLTAYGLKWTGRTSIENAKDLASAAIADLLTKPDSWDPEKEPILKNLSRRLIGIAKNEWHRKRNQFEVRMRGSAREEALEVSSEEESIGDVLDRRRLAARFHERLARYLAGKPMALLVIDLMKQGYDTPLAQLKAASLPPEKLDDLRDARRRVFHYAEIVKKELGLELEEEEDRKGARASDDDDSADAPDEEVTQ